MIRSALIMVWVILVTSSVAYFTFGSKVAAVMPKQEVRKKEAIIEISEMAIPVMRNSVMRGYLLVDLGIASEAEIAGEQRQLVEIAVRNAAIRSIYADDKLDIFQLDKLDIDKMQGAILSAVKQDEIVDSSSIARVYVKSINYLPIDSLRRE